MGLSRRGASGSAVLGFLFFGAGSNLLVLVGAAIIAATPLRGQAPIILTGTVTDSSGAPIIGASVSVVGVAGDVTTSEKGVFQLSTTSASGIKVKVRRLGFAPLVREIAVDGSSPMNRLQLILSAIPVSLKPVVVEASHVEYSGRLAGYYQRLQRRTGGYFISREEIDRKSFRDLSQLLSGVPGINAFALRSGGGAVRMRGQACRPLVWLDGVAMPAGEVDLDAFPTSTLHGIELYLGVSSSPAEFVLNDGSTSCGTILLWSRGRDTEPDTRIRPRVDLEGLVESLKVFPANQVDEQAQLVGGDALALAYPPELFAGHMAGSVLVEFVVDTAGKVEADTYFVVSSTHPLFSAAVSRALEKATFAPARKNGKVVREAVQLPFRFVPSIRKGE